jgi:carnitine O-acetyltransferase
MQDVQRATLFRRAMTRHLQFAAWAADGQGVDRHLFGLKKMIREGEPTPEIYKDEAYTKTSHWELSTSQLSSDYFDGWGYGEGAFNLQNQMKAISYPTFLVVSDGYGLAYSINNHSIRWTITSLKRNTDELKHYLEEAATETRMMMERAAAAEGKQGESKPEMGKVKL